MEAPIPDDCPAQATSAAHTVGPLFPVYGMIHPAQDSVVDDTALDVFAADGAIAALAGPVTGPGTSREFVVLTTDDDRVACVDEGRQIEAGVRLHELASSLVQATGHAVDLGDVVVAPRESSSHEALLPASVGAPEPPEVSGIPDNADIAATSSIADRTSVQWARSRRRLSRLMARKLGCPLQVAAVPDDEGWLLVRPTEQNVASYLQHFGADELPVVELSQVCGERAVSVLTAPGYLPGAHLTRLEPWVTSWEASQFDHLAAADHGVALEAFAWFADPHLAPDSDLQMLCSSGGVGSTIDAEAVATALQSPDDDQWSTRVLTALGFPVILADVHEGRATMPEGHLVEPAGLGAALAGMFRRPRGRGGRPVQYRAP